MGPSHNSCTNCHGQYLYNFTVREKTKICHRHCSWRGDSYDVKNDKSKKLICQILDWDLTDDIIIVKGEKIRAKRLFKSEMPEKFNKEAWHFAKYAAKQLKTTVHKLYAQYMVDTYGSWHNNDDFFKIDFYLCAKVFNKKKDDIEKTSTCAGCSVALFNEEDLCLNCEPDREKIKARFDKDLDDYHRCAGCDKCT